MPRAADSYSIGGWFGPAVGSVHSEVGFRPSPARCPAICSLLLRPISSAARGRDSYCRGVCRGQLQRTEARWWISIGGRSPCADMPDPRRRTDQGVPEAHGELPVLPATTLTPWWRAAGSCRANAEFTVPVSLVTEVSYYRGKLFWERERYHGVTLILLVCETVLGWIQLTILIVFHGVAKNLCQGMAPFARTRFGEAGPCLGRELAY